MYVKFPSAKKVKNVYIYHGTDQYTWEVRLYNQNGNLMKQALINQKVSMYSIDDVPSESTNAIYLEFQSINNEWWFAPSEIAFEFYD